ncbi:N-acetylmuramoyl-L-alanine amidase [Nocardiopsis gilva YIM 90087]|uniref:N-acetylmuramoyl-L-alanine amidase n=1 Tax=Nocardiopsis gilva YIM 90087 TaxID=1235441 RepID=A0A223S0S3_9ACTN|nr:peptidoglycan recognition family protein [Nocardiopsis gilva]ASU81718.1 N-acetylmuramoyl-L-alanine amidase [Nocardiopsis gilva YIM 90087]
MSDRPWNDDDQGRGVSRRGALHTAALAAGGALLGGAAVLGDPEDAVAAARPYIYTRSQWRARSARRSAKVLSRGPDRIVVHHTASSNSSNYSKSHAAALSRAIQRHHMDTNGWDDIGQQLTISRGGYVMEGRNRVLSALQGRDHVVGAHTANHNAHTIGIENEGTYNSATPPRALMDALTDTCAWLCSHYRLNPYRAIVGHRDYNSTTCPGDKLYSMLPELRKSVAQRMSTLLPLQVRVDDLQLPLNLLPASLEVPSGVSGDRVAEFYHGPALSKREAERWAVSPNVRLG